MSPLRLAREDEPCAFCRETPASGAFGRPCSESPDNLHWTAGQLMEDANEREATIAQYLRRAAYELEQVAIAIEALPPRVQRKVLREERLDPFLIRNEAERARDALHVGRLLDV